MVAVVVTVAETKTKRSFVFPHEKLSRAFTEEFGAFAGTTYVALDDGHGVYAKESPEEIAEQVNQKLAAVAAAGAASPRPAGP